jgi:hypothetical protein
MGKKFLRFCDEYHIRVDWAAVAHPRTNKQVERMNGMILQGIKPRIFNKLNKFGGWWVIELPALLWSLRMTPSRATGYTPFFTVIQYKELEAKECLEDALDQLGEARDVALLHSTKYQQALRRYQSRRIRGPSFQCRGLGAMPCP